MMGLNLFSRSSLGNYDPPNPNPEKYLVKHVWFDESGACICRSRRSSIIDRIFVEALGQRKAKGEL